MSQKTTSEPLDFIRLLLDEKVHVKLRGFREITGKLQVSGLFSRSDTLQILTISRPMTLTAT